MDELTRAVFNAVYNSARQRLLRMLFCGMIVMKHTIRGFAFSWPLYLLTMAATTLPGEWGWLYLLLLLPALIISLSILLLGFSEDYQSLIAGKLHKIREWKIMIGGSESSSA